MEDDYYSCSSNFSIGLDSLDILNNKIKSLLYPKPNTSRSQIKNLNKITNTRIFFIVNTFHLLNTCVCEIIPNNKKYSHILIFTHGNGCDIYTMYPYLKELADNLDVMVVCWDYPSYGLSEGELNEHTCYTAFSDVVNHYKKHINKILLVGQSLGTGIVVDYTSKNKWSNPIILISPYKSIPTVFIDSSFIEYLICKHKYSTQEKIINCKCPIKLFHGKSDALIDITHSYDLYELMPNKQINPTWFNNIGHNDILNKINFLDYKKILQLF